MTRSLRRLRHDDEGISFVLIAVVMIALLGMVAFAVDAGALYQERRELQNGSDAAVLAIAEDCGRGAKPCDDLTAEATAQQYADANADDTFADLEPGSLILDTTLQTIEVVTRTETSDGGTVFKPFFAQVLGFDGATVRARSKAAWGLPAGSVPLTISTCEWEVSKARILAAHPEFENPWYPKPASGDSYDDYRLAYGPIEAPHPAWDGWDPTADPPDDPPDYPPHDPGVGVRAIFHQGQAAAKETECTAVAGQDDDGDDKLDGGFGWLELALPKEECRSEAVFGGVWYAGDGGNSAPTECKDKIAGLLGTIIGIPVYDDVVKCTGPNQPPQCAEGLGNKRYHMVGTMGLLLTAYKFQGNSDWENIDGGRPCKASEACLVGYPTEFTATGGPIDPNGQYLGVLAVVLLD